MKFYRALVFIFLAITSCQNLSKEELTNPEPNNRVVIISVNSPVEKYMHYLQNDTLGKPSVTEGVYTPIFNRFDYIDANNVLQQWTPQLKQYDTLVVEWYKEYFELSCRHPYTTMPLSFLLNKGDTIMIDYEDYIPVASIKNRIVNDTILNFNKYRLKELYNNGYSTHWRVMGDFFKATTFDKEKDILKIIERYKLVKKGLKKEKEWINSLPFDKNELTYRMNVLDVTMEGHRQLKHIAEWEKLRQISNENVSDESPLFDIEQTDSLMNFSFFRSYLKYYIKYEVPQLTMNFPGGGANLRDPRARFDSIAMDVRLKQTAKDYLLTTTYKEILDNFSAEEKEEYFNKLAAITENPSAIQHLKNKYNLDFNLSDKLILIDPEGNETTYAEVLEANKGKWLYIDFWATWCKPCVALKPKAIELEKALKNAPITFINIAHNDDKERWFKKMDAEIPANRKEYLSINGNISRIPDDLHINSIPHYIIYNPEGEKVIDYAQRPGEGAKEQLDSLIVNFKSN